MTSPINDGSLAPARRNRARFSPVVPIVPTAPTPTEFSGAEIARGQADAVLGALARMQLKLDLLTREHSDSLARVEALLARLEHRLDQNITPV